MSETIRLPSLIQRMERRREDRKESKGVDALFSLDYMGSAEFEFGAIPKALKSMRAAKNESWIIRTIQARACVAYYVGTTDSLEVAKALFEDQLKPRDQRSRTKEASRIHETYLPPDPKDKFAIRDKFDGWWVIDGSPPFAMFKDKAHAEAFLGAL